MEKFKKGAMLGIGVLGAFLSFAGMVHGVDVAVNGGDLSADLANQVFGPEKRHQELRLLWLKIAEWDQLLPRIVKEPPAFGALVASVSALGAWKSTDLLRGK